jgi:membrane protein insertase Oxa1/YidC/SpoIIIJ
VYTVPFFGWHVESFNLLPFLMGITMYLQQKLMPKAKTEPKSGTNPQMDQAAQMQKMMPIMSIFFVFILYAMPSGLNLYIMTSSLVGTLEQWRIRKHIREEKERAPAETPVRPVPAKPRKPSWFMKKIQNLQKQAELAQQTQSKRKKR